MNLQNAQIQEQENVRRQRRTLQSPLEPPGAFLFPSEDIGVICGSNLFGKSREEYPPITQIHADLKGKRAYIGVHTRPIHTHLPVIASGDLKPLSFHLWTSASSADQIFSENPGKSIHRLRRFKNNKNVRRQRRTLQSLPQTSGALSFHL